MEKKHTFFGLLTIRPFLRPYRAVLLGMIVISALGSMIDVGVPLFQRYALDHFVAQSTLRGIWVFAAVYLGLILFAALANYISCVWGMKIEVSVDRDLRNAAFDHLQTLSFSYYKDRKSVV